MSDWPSRDKVLKKVARAARGGPTRGRGRMFSRRSQGEPEETLELGKHTRKKGAKGRDGSWLMSAFGLWPLSGVAVMNALLRPQSSAGAS